MFHGDLLVCWRVNTVDGSDILHQLSLVVYPIIYDRFYSLQDFWTINSIKKFPAEERRLLQQTKASKVKMLFPINATMHRFSTKMPVTNNALVWKLHDGLYKIMINWGCPLNLKEQEVLF